MLCERTSSEYINGVQEFVEFAAAHARDANNIMCPCMRCLYGKCVNPIGLMNHLICNGIDQSYKRWTKHGETDEVECREREPDVSSASNDMFDQSDEDCLEEMVKIVGEENPEIFEELKSDAETPLYAGSKYSRLRAVVKLYNIKARYGKISNHIIMA